MSAEKHSLRERSLCAVGVDAQGLTALARRGVDDRYVLQRKGKQEEKGRAGVS